MTSDDEYNQLNEQLKEIQAKMAKIIRNDTFELIANNRAIIDSMPNYIYLSRYDAGHPIYTFVVKVFDKPKKVLNTNAIAEVFQLSMFNYVFDTEHKFVDIKELMHIHDNYKIVTMDDIQRYADERPYPINFIIKSPQ